MHRPRRIGDTSLERGTLSRIASQLCTCQVLPRCMLAKAVGVSFYGNTPMQCRYRTRDELVSDAKESESAQTRLDLMEQKHIYLLISSQIGTSFCDAIQVHTQNFVQFLPLCAAHVVVTCEEV